ncbi:MAG: single-stranded DNA-binding protein [Malacoplasma sp.]|nr:single-stranded DNA-binding protein [Malacoplasma sp.]
MNKVFMVGRLAQDPQQFVTQNGIKQSRISIASSDNWNRKETYFFPCVAWQTTADFINTYLHKGDLVAVDGKLIRRSYISKEGKTVYVIEVVIESIKPLSSFASRNENRIDMSSSIDKDYNAYKTNVSTNYSNQESLDNQFQKKENLSETKPNVDDQNFVNLDNDSFNDDPFAFDSNDKNDGNLVDLEWFNEFKE